MKPASTPALAAALLVGLSVTACGRPGPKVDEGVAEPREIVPGLVRPEARFEVAPEIGEPFPDIEIVDDQGRPVRVRELAGRKPYTVLTLGCLT